MHRVALILVLALAACAPPAQHLSISYSPYRDNQAPGQATPSADQLLEDLKILAGHWPKLRTYGSSEFAEPMLALIRDHNLDLKVLLGAWLAPNSPTGNLHEVRTATTLANRYPDIVEAISVGNETQVHWSAHKSPADTLVHYLRMAKSRVDIPVATADDYNFWNQPESQRVAAEVDFILLHAHPMWNGVQPEQAVPWLEEQTRQVEALHPKLEVVIGETGWATRVHSEGEQAELIWGPANEPAQARVYRDIRAWARRTGRTVYWFEAFDEKWKGGPHPDEVEKHWGLFHSDRTPKAAMRPD